MDTLRVDVCYRPLRIAWLINGGDWRAFRRAVRSSHALWGGRFNPIVCVDNDSDARAAVELFRPDILFPLSEEGPAADLPQKFPHLILPFDLRQMFTPGTSYSDPSCMALDIDNMMAYLRDAREWKEVCERGVELLSWEPDDPLADALLAQFGGYPEPEDVGSDYRGLVLRASGAGERALTATEPIPSQVLDKWTPSSLARLGLKPHYSIRQAHELPGFYVGRAGDMHDLVSFWNLRACGIRLMFVDLERRERYSLIATAWAEIARDDANERRGLLKGSVAIWTRQADLEGIRAELSVEKPLLCRVSDATWNGLGVQAPMMYFGRSSALGVISTSGSRRRLSFSLSDRPFATEPWFVQQHLVVSIHPFEGVPRNGDDTWKVPYVPELNEAISRAMAFRYDRLRCEPGRLGVIIGAGETDCVLDAMPLGELFRGVFGLAGFDARVSAAGRILQQLLARLGGPQGARVFKIHGVRRLLKTHGPKSSFSKRAALQLIGSRDTGRPEVSFSDYEDLYIEPRERGEGLSPESVLGYLVERDLLRIGANLTCRSCGLPYWCSLDDLGRETVCELCGARMAPARQLVTGDPWAYRRSGILGAEKNAGGAVPVAVTLQQLDANLGGLEFRGLYSPSLELERRDSEEKKACEIDLVWLMPRNHPQKTALIIAECKDVGPIDEVDIQSLRGVADSLPAQRFDVFVLLAQLAPFSAQQIEWARSLNGDYLRRVILLTARELEPFVFYERVNRDLGLPLHASQPEELADTTARLYFGE